ncbi:DUF202 domain-containing protein [Brachybacterium sp. AOP42-C2-15]|uniref:DUF202 domain-containing protein n=1 Tax=Brachybacterium TaxID=43668 RepID=UPI003F95963D
MNSQHNAVFDSGLQPERTLLAWRRTCLSFGVTSLVAMRFMVEALGVLAVFGGLLAAGLAVLAYSLTAWGYRRAHASLHADGALHYGGWAQLCAAVAVLAIGIQCAVFLLVGQ